jgi:hypothetical protein
MAPLGLCKHALKPGVRPRPDSRVAAVAGALPTAIDSDESDTRSSASAAKRLTVPQHAEQIARSRHAVRQRSRACRTPRLGPEVRRSGAPWRPAQNRRVVGSRSARHPTC